MARFWPEPEHTHGSPRRIGILLVNLGTPAAPTAAALRPYLRQFLSDPRVVEIPRLIWWPILHGFILTRRPAKSAEKYASVWTDEGSPLKVHTERQAKLVAGYFTQAGRPDLVVDWAMRYGAPSVIDGLVRLRARHCDRILVVPLYPQYAASTTASAMDQVAECLQHWRDLPELRYVRNFHDHPDYIGALAQSVRDHWMKNGQADKLIMSFHGIPRRSLDLGDPYHCECYKTARLVAEALELPTERWQVTFQSRFGKAEWLKPYTEPTLQALAAGGLRSVDVMCPGFVADCLETLEEVAMECKTAFLSAGGQQFHYIPCLNERHDWIAALIAVCRQHIGDWLAHPQPDEAAREQSARRARDLGATR